MMSDQGVNVVEEAQASPRGLSEFGLASRGRSRTMNWFLRLICLAILALLNAVPAAASADGHIHFSAQNADSSVSLARTCWDTCSSRPRLMPRSEVVDTTVRPSVRVFCKDMSESDAQRLRTTNRWMASPLRPLLATRAGSQVPKSVGAAATRLGNLKKVGNSYLKKLGVDAHAVKREFAGKGSISKYNISRTPEGNVFLTPTRKGGGPPLDTGMTLDELIQTFPLGGP